jgi:hypothetical protein
MRSLIHDNLTKCPEMHREVIAPKERFLVLRDMVLHTAPYVVIETPCVRLFMHELICANVRVMIFRLCCRMLLKSPMHGYLDPIL